MAVDFIEVQEGAPDHLVAQAIEWFRMERKIASYITVTPDCVLYHDALDMKKFDVQLYVNSRDMPEAECKTRQAEYLQYYKDHPEETQPYKEEELWSSLSV